MSRLHLHRSTAAILRNSPSPYTYRPPAAAAAATPLSSLQPLLPSTQTHHHEPRAWTRTRPTTRTRRRPAPPAGARGIATTTADTDTDPNAHVTKTALFSASHITALVTGGGTGIGLMIAQALQTAGARVYITGRRADALSRVVDLYSPPRSSPMSTKRQGRGSIIALPGDISQKSECLRLAAEVSAREPGGIQLLVNNAGIARDSSTSFASVGKPDMSSAEGISSHFLKSEPSAWAETFETNVTAGFFMSMAFLPVLARGHERNANAEGEEGRKAGGNGGLVEGATGNAGGYTSSIVNVSSISGAMKGSSGGQFAYAASKAAFTHLTRMLATTFLGTGVRVNGIAPGLFPSEMTTSNATNPTTQKSIPDTYASTNPAGRKGTDADMAATILFLAGRGGAFYNCQVLYPDGGMVGSVPAAV